MWRRALALTAMVAAMSAPACLAQQCRLEPPAGVTNSLRSPGSGGYSLQVSGDPERYVPGSVYTVSLTAPPGKSFRRFLVTVEPADRAERRWAGSFQLFADAAAQFASACINAVSEGEAADPAPQVEVQAMWRAPSQGSGCVRFRAMVLEDEALWFADEGALSRTLCELAMPHHQDADSDEARECCACDDAKYKFVFQGLWSNVTHPKDFPFSLWLTHFSDVIGASHEANFSFWGEGEEATDGFRQLAEWGSVGWLERELRAKSAHLRTLVKASGLWYPRVTQNTSASFSVDRRRHLLSLASMFGPSPDWVVGVSGLDLCLPDCSWEESKIIDLYPIDAGTDSGITYMSANAPTVPREKMYRITTMYPEDPRAPFYDPTGAPMQPMARLHITRETVIPKPCRDEDDVQSEELEKEAAFEDTETADDGERPECRVDEWTPWSPCSVSCGKGLRMRQRNYQMAAKADMLGCDRQLVQKEMCVAHDASCPGDPVELDPNEIGAATSDVEQPNCAVTPWGPWSDCSASCGPGFEVRSRRFEDRMGLKKCPFIELTDRRKCSLPACVDAVPDDPNCRLTEWSDWSPCSVSCGSGRKFRTRLVLVADEVLRERYSRYHTLSEERPCSIKETCITSTADAEEACLQVEEPGPCRAYFERWYFDRDARQCRPFGYGGCRGNRNNFHSLTECNTVCAGVKEKLIRGVILAPRISAPAAAPAPGPFTRPEAVSSSGPRVDCVVSEWSDWSACSATCGIGNRERTRRVLVEPIRGGRICPTRLRGRKRCYGGPCDPFQEVDSTF